MCLKYIVIEKGQSAVTGGGEKKRFPHIVDCKETPVVLSFFIIFLFVFLFQKSWSVETTKHRKLHEIYVSPGGRSEATGSKEDPFASLQGARDAIRQAKSDYPGNFLQKTTTVYLRRGFYSLSESLLLDGRDSGGEKHPIIYRAYQEEKVSITGAIRISPEMVRSVSDKAISERIIEVKARDQVREIDLKSLNVPNTINWKISGFGRPYVESGIELFINGKPYFLAGYPNQGKIQIHPEDVLDPGIKDSTAYPGKLRFPSDRIKHWPKSSEAMAFGSFAYAWATDQLRIGAIDPEKQEITFADTHVYGLSGMKEWNKYRIFNLLEEIDQPGEFYVERAAGKLYFYPYSPINPQDTILVSVLGDPLVKIEHADNINFEGITFEASRGIGVSIVNGRNNLLKNCVLRNLGMLAVRIGKGYNSFGSSHHNLNSEGGHSNGILNCWIENIGSGGICLGGGDRKTLEPAGNLISDCEFTNCGRLAYAYKCPVNIHGVGNIIRHCNFNESPATDIYLHGNNHIIEYNLIQDACTFMDDQGAFYLGRNPSESGNVVRYNLFKNIGRFGRTMAVYLDDGACGTSVYGNVFYKAGSRNIVVGGGSFNPVTANIFIDSTIGILLGNRLSSWGKKWILPGALFDQKLREVNYRNPPYSQQYPGLANFFENHPEQPKGNDISYNIFINAEQNYKGEKEWGPVLDNNRSLNQVIDLKDIGQIFWTKEELRNIRKKIPGFEPFDWNQIGCRGYKN